MAVRQYIKFDGVEGESRSRDHKGEIEVLSWHWGLTNAVPSGGSGAGGGGAGRAHPSDLRFMHVFDKASPLLARAGAGGTHFKEVVLSARKSGEGQKDFLKITMKEVFITSVQWSSAESEGPMEEVAVAPRHFAVEYSPQDSKGGLGAPVRFSWDIAANVVK